MGYQDLMNKVFDRLTVIEFVGQLERGRAVWKCRCICGKEVVTRARNLTKGHKKSCGCLPTWRIKHGGKHEKLFAVWRDMKARCNTPKCCNFKNYGARGIKVDSIWLDYAVFREWANSNGYKTGLSIDRIDVNGNYTPENCRWATSVEQAFNKRTTVLIEHEGKKYNCLDLEKICGINRETIRRRINEGWLYDEIINIKSGTRRWPKNMLRKSTEIK